MEARIVLPFPDDHDEELVAEIYFGDAFFGQVCEGVGGGEMAYEVFDLKGTIARVSLADFEKAIARAKQNLMERRSHRTS